MKQELIERLNQITDELGGEMHHLTTLDHSGRTSQKVVIEYDIHQKEEQ